jgi:hypothetical protein
MDTKRKGLIAELKVAARLIETGWRVLYPADESSRYDLVAERDGRFYRIQVKYVTSQKGRLAVNCRSSNNWSVKPYTSEEIDVIAAHDPGSNETYFIPVHSLNRNLITLRLTEARNNQKNKVRYARDFTSLSEALGPGSGQKEADDLSSLGR